MNLPDAAPSPGHEIDEDGTTMSAGLLGGANGASGAAAEGAQGAAPLRTDRAALLAAVAERGKMWDVVVVGGGASGLGIALDAATRGWKVLLVESYDFAGGTSSRATKLLHGGVRYLAQGDIGLVREALHERKTVLHIAPHLAQPLPFVMPSYRWWETPFYGVGLKAYDALAGNAGLGPTRLLSRRKVLQLLPGLNPTQLKGGVKYWDAQFDDARLAIALARSAAAAGATLVNYIKAEGLVHKPSGAGGMRVAGVHLRCRETKTAFEVRARCVINATGVWVDGLRQIDGEALQRPVRSMVAPSQGVHLVVPRHFSPGEHALLVPKTADGRVLFAVPWMGALILGTTDTPRPDVQREPRPLAQEVEFILSEAARYLARPPKTSDVLSAWVGLRPLVKPMDDDAEATKGLSREHTVLVSKSGLVTVTGGKWTTYRAMAEDVLQRCAQAGLLPSERLTPSVTALHRLVGAPAAGVAQPGLTTAGGMHLYGSDATWVARLPGASTPLGSAPGDADLVVTEAMVRFAARYEYARTVEDVLARRSRLLFVDARRAQRLAPSVARILTMETGHDPMLEHFIQLAKRYASVGAA